MTRLTSTLLIVLALSGCGISGNGTPAPAESAPVAAPVATPVATPPALPFTNRVWRVAAGSDIPEGSLYVFLSDNTLLITSDNAKPAIGRWLASGNGITMIEEGMQYRTEILEQTADRFVIRQHNPGGSVKIVFGTAATRR